MSGTQKKKEKKKRRSEIQSRNGRAKALSDSEKKNLY
jgi:hypothetical protein